MRLKPFCAEPAAIAAYAPLVTEDGRSFGVTLVRPIPGAFAARLTGVASREAAEALKGSASTPRATGCRRSATTSSTTPT